MQSKFARTKTSYLNQTSWNTALCKMELQRMLPSNVVLTASGVQHLPLGLSAKFLVGTFTDMRLGVLSTAGRGVTGRGNGGTIPRARNHYGGAKSLWGCQITVGSVEWQRGGGRWKIPKISQVLSSLHHICFRKTSGSKMGASSLLLAPGAI